MNDRREPTISNMRATTPNEDARARSNASAQPANKRPAQPRATPPVRPVIVKSTLAPIAFLFALIACAGAGYLYWQLMESQKAQALMSQRLVSVEESLKLTGSESMASVGEINESLTTHFSEIDKLWATYRKHKTDITENKSANDAVKKQFVNVSNQVKSQVAEMRVISDLVDAQQNALTGIEKKSASVLTQAKASSDKNAALERKLADLERKIKETEKDIEAINGFRRSVNQQLLELKGGAQ